MGFVLIRICFDKDFEITKGLQGRMPWWSPFAYLLLMSKAIIC